MRVSLKWLADYVDVALPPEELAHRLTMAGLEVETIDRIGGDWDDKLITVGLVTAVEPHPNADRLRLATVDLGEGERMTVVCGAPNVEAGQKVAFARDGASLIDGRTGKPTALRPATIRGVQSAGMVCPAKELGLSAEHEGILALPSRPPGRRSRPPRPIPPARSAHSPPSRSPAPPSSTPRTPPRRQAAAPTAAPSPTVSGWNSPRR